MDVEDDASCRRFGKFVYANPWPTTNPHKLIEEAQARANASEHSGPVTVLRQRNGNRSRVTSKPPRAR